MLDGGRLVECSRGGRRGAGGLAGDAVGGGDGGAPSAVVVVRGEAGRLDRCLQSAAPRIVQCPRCLSTRPAANRLFIERGGAGRVMETRHPETLGALVHPETLVGLEGAVPAALALPRELGGQAVAVPGGQAVVGRQAVHLQKQKLEICHGKSKTAQRFLKAHHRQHCCILCFEWKTTEHAELFVVKLLKSKKYCESPLPFHRCKYIRRIQI